MVLMFTAVVHHDVLVAVESMMLSVLSPMVMYPVIDAESHSIEKEVTPVVIQRFTLTLMFNRGDVLAVDVQEDAAVKDVAKSKKWSFDVADENLTGKLMLLQTSKMSL